MNRKILIGWLIIFCSASCSQKKNNPVLDEELMILVPDSELYVRIRGDINSPLIINLHGGPGGYSGIDMILMGPNLEDHFLIAYLDQRGCGKSLPCPDTSMLTIGQYLEDLDLVIDSLRKRYNKMKVNLIGTSWGGMYGFLYLLDGNDVKVNAFACIDGKVNSEYQNTFLIQYQSEKVNKLLSGEISMERRTELEDIATRLAEIKRSSYKDFYKNVNWMLHEVSPTLGFNAYFVDTSRIISINEILQDTALLSLMKYTAGEYLEIGEKAEFINQVFLDRPEYNDINIVEQLERIKIPTAVIQGEFDYVVGPGHAELVYNALTSLSPPKKELHILPDIGHCPAIECPEVLATILVRFFGKHTK